MTLPVNRQDDVISGFTQPQKQGRRPDQRRCVDKPVQ